MLEIFGFMLGVLSALVANLQDSTNANSLVTKWLVKLIATCILLSISFILVSKKLELLIVFLATFLLFKFFTIMSLIRDNK